MMNGSQYKRVFSGICLMLTFGALTGQPLLNVAFNKKAVQSSEHTPGTAGRAVDGQRDPDHGSCILTNKESNPWWRVDLQDAFRIRAVLITNTGDLKNKLDGGEIWIGNSEVADHADNTRCAVISHIPSGHTLYFSCAVTGRYVTVRLPGREKVLSLCEVEVYLENSCEQSLSNVALRGEAAQSSTLSFFADAAKAIDGRRNSFYASGSCSHTAEAETNPWWRVDLKATHIVASVKITNRGDCCAERLDGAEIRIGDSLEDNGNSNARCASISHIRAGKTHAYYCDGGNMAGRFVNVIIPGEGKTLALCEVEVYSASAVEPLHNVALNKPANQSGGGAANAAVRGCSSTTFSDGCCSHTANLNDSWWNVDLLEVHKISAVTLINRQDCCPERILGIQLWVGSSLQLLRQYRCGFVSSLGASPVLTFRCGDREGRYVYVIRPGHEKPLTLCGVEVYASLPASAEVSPPPTLLLPTTPPPLSPTPTPSPTPTVSMLLSGKTITVVGDRLCWSDALLYCRLHHWDLLSLHSPEEQREVEQLLRGSPVPLTGFVWLGLRRYIMSSMWFWMSGDSMTFTKWPRDSPPEPHSSPCGGLATGERHLWEDQPCDEHLNFICQSGAVGGEDGRVYFYSTRERLSEG